MSYLCPKHPYVLFDFLNQLFYNYTGSAKLTVKLAMQQQHNNSYYLKQQLFIVRSKYVKYKLNSGRLPFTSGSFVWQLQFHGTLGPRQVFQAEGALACCGSASNHAGIGIG